MAVGCCLLVSHLATAGFGELQLHGHTRYRTIVLELIDKKIKFLAGNIPVVKGPYFF